MSDLSALIHTKNVLICCGSGGVGKTTVSAAIGIAAAKEGQRVCVVTIDPARRLADALSSTEVGNDPVQLEGDYDGALFAVMLDARATFDDLVARYAATREQAERIASNRIYQNLVSSVSGMQEYMASEKLYELTESGSYDLVVVDTPPTRSALDFLEAPNKLGAFLHNRMFRAVMDADKGVGKAFSFATRPILRSLSNLAGARFVDDVITFFRAFSGMEAGLALRSARISTLLTENTTAYVLVTTARNDAIAEAEFFAGRLRANHHDVAALIVNRIHPDFSVGALPPRTVGQTAWDELVENLTELDDLARHERQAINELRQQIATETTIGIPILSSDVHDRETLDLLARYLISNELRF